MKSHNLRELRPHNSALLRAERCAYYLLELDFDERGQPVLCGISMAARLAEGTAESAKDVLQDLGRGRKVEPDMALAGFAKVQPLAEGDLRVL